MAIKVNVFKRPDRNVFYAQYADPVTGQKVRQSTGETKRREAERVAAKWEAEVNQGDYVQPDRMSWEVFRHRYEDECLPGLSEGSEKKYCCVLNVFERLINPSSVRVITTDVIRRYQAKLRSDGRSESTIKSHTMCLSAMLTYAVEIKAIPKRPPMPKVKRSSNKARHTAKLAKGRAVTLEEFERMLSVVPKVLAWTRLGISFTPSDDDVESWRFFLRGLYWSGLRIGEAMDLHWSDEDRLCVENLHSRCPLLWIPDHAQKRGLDEKLPMAPEFAQMLRNECDAFEGFVFNPATRVVTRRMCVHRAGEIVSRIGKAAGVKVSKTKFASAHDFRRSFGLRWADRVKPHLLQRLMRHADIQTTMKYYVNVDAKDEAEMLWQAAGTHLGTHPAKRPVKAVK